MPECAEFQPRARRLDLLEMAAVPAYRRTFVRLLGFLRPYKWGLAVSVVLAIGSQAAAVVRASSRGRAQQAVAVGDPRSSG